MAGVNQMTPGAGSASIAPLFSQQGQVDWVAFGNTIWSASAAVLQRFSSAGVQPVTYAAGIALASSFRLNQLGRQRMDETLSRLEAVAGFDRVLWFGFGYRGLVKVMAETQQGVGCVALIACLVDSHTEHMTAWILEALWKIQKFPEQYEPSHTQFVALVRCCAGVVARTEFARVVDIMSGHMLHRFREQNKERSQQASTPEATAKALQGIFRVSQGTIEKITLLGGPECAFLAAFAYWLLDLSVNVEDDESKVIFTSVEDPNLAQITIRYISLREVSSTTLQTTSTTFILGSFEEMLIRSPAREDLTLLFRTRWEACLSRAFGSRFHELLQQSFVIGHYLGASARIMSSYAKGEDVRRADGSVIWLNQEYQNHVPGSFGYGFVESVGSIFPELQDTKELREHMLHALDLKTIDAEQMLHQSSLTLKDLCRCEHCGDGTTGDRYCFVAMAICIRHLVCTLSCAEWDADLLPSVTGIGELYSSIGIEIEHLMNLEENIEDQGTYGLCCSKPPMVRHMADTLDDTILIFNGDWRAPGLSNNSRTQTKRVASSRGGICGFIQSLKSISASADVIRKIYVVAGTIESGDRTYEMVFDCDACQVSPLVEEVRYESTTTAFPIEPTQHESIEVTACVTEATSDRTLLFYYRFSMPKGFVFVQPGLITRKILKKTVIMRCGQARTPSEDFPCLMVRRGWRLTGGMNLEWPYRDGISCLLWNYHDDIARWLALAVFYNDGVKDFSESFAVILRRHECRPCCALSTEQVSSLIERDFPSRSGKKIILHVI